MSPLQVASMYGRVNVCILYALIIAIRYQLKLIAMLTMTNEASTKQHRYEQLNFHSVRRRE